MTNETKFRPVVGTEQKILDAPNSPGWVYFASDTGKIYLDIDSNERMVMSGSGSVIYYANDANPYETGYNDIFQIHLDALEDENASLKENDLIINIDKCFYRVVEVNEDDGIISALKIAVSGSGSGGGSGEGPAMGGYCSVSAVDGSDYTFLFGKSCPIKFNVVAKDASGEDTIGGKVTWYLNRRPILKDWNVRTGLNIFDVGEYITDGTLESQELRGEFKLDIGNGTEITNQTKTWRLTVANIKMTWDNNPTRTLILAESFDLRWKIIGGNNIQKYTHIIIDGKEVEVVDIGKNPGDKTFKIERNKYGLNHGVHKIKLYTSFEITQEQFETEEIERDLIFATEDNTIPIIALGNVPSNMFQYDTIPISVYVYNSNSLTIYEIDKNGNDKRLTEWTDEIEDSNTTIFEKIFSYTPITAGVKKIRFVAGNSIEYIIDIVVEALDLNVEEPKDYVFKFKGNEKISDNNTLQSWESNGITATFSDNFDWNNGGYYVGEDNNPCVLIKAGTSMTINYDLFKTFNIEKGKTLKIVFKVENCGKYDTEIIKCYSKEDSTPVGLLMTPQEALFQSRDNKIKTQYCEGTYIEYEIDITKSQGTGFKYIMPWLAGVPAGVIDFSQSGDYFQQENTVPITIGSEDCDIYLYLFKVYERHLSDEEHLENFIMDALNANEMINRYTRNDILNDSGNGEIDWRKLVAKNPDCWVHLYNIPRMSTGKKDEVGKDYLGGKTEAETPKYYALYKDGNPDEPVLRAGTDVDKPFSYKVQGTSSEKYIISAANLDSDFRNYGFIDVEGNDLEAFSLEDELPGESYFNTKVNVASCEGANNALNAEWYNKYQPYQSAAKAQAKKEGKIKRDTMLFKPGVVFIKDDNPNYNIEASNKKYLELNIFTGNDAYKDEPFYKQYAVCNFGNSKKNCETLHDINNPSEICIEVTDNQNIGQHMCQVSGRKYEDLDGNITQDLIVHDITNEIIEYDEETKKGNSTYEAFKESMNDKDYDVRYANKKDGIDKASSTQIKGFFNLVQWFAQNDPSPYDPVAHPHGYTGEPFTAESKNVEFFAEPIIYNNLELYLDNEGVTKVSKSELMDGIIYYKKQNIVTGQTENGQDIIVTTYVPAELYIDYALSGYGYTFTPYTFKTNIEFETGSGYHHSYKSQLGGLTVSKYARRYYADTHEYRMAKMLSECEDHLIMDSIIYHYLFIEKHLMVDNVAKNTFWTSEDKDNKLWSLIKDYDNDTADGIDNDGKLTFTYGIEPTDLQPDGEQSYFNAPNTVWFNFVHGLEEPRRLLYTILKDAWNVPRYLEAFEKWQSAIPERCWIEDYYRKYIRPKELFGDDSYLAKLEGGQKKYQRRQFEIYQNDYLNSKYQVIDGESIYLRANETQPSKIVIPVTMYSDCYVYQSWSQNIVRDRVKRGEIYEIRVPSTITRLDDATVYWHLPQTYSTIGNLGVINPKGVTLGGARRLQSLDITSQKEDGIAFNSKESLAIGQATLLRHLKLNGIRRKDSDSFPLDLKNLFSLQDFDGNDSNFTAIYFPENAPLNSIKVNNPQTISLRKLYQINNLEIQDISQLKTVLIEDIDNNENVNSLTDIILKANNLKQYCLHKVKWRLDEVGHIDDSTNKIDFLEKIKLARPVDIEGLSDTNDPAGALTGTLIISEKAYDGDNALKIYQEYIKTFPKLDIIFESEKCHLSEVTIVDGNGKTVWRRKFQNVVIVTKEFLTEEGNNFLNYMNQVINSKENSIDKEYTFNNRWYYSTGDWISVTPDDSDPSAILPINLSKHYSQDIVISPEFREEPRQYHLKYYNGTEQLADIQINYDEPFSVIELPTIPHKDDSDLDLEETYKFIGWSFIPNGNEDSVIKDYNNMRVTGNNTFYAVFTKSSVYDNVLDEKYLAQISTSFTSPRYYRTTGKSYDKSGLIVTIKDQYSHELFGKITLPISFKGKPIYGYNLENGTSGTSGIHDNITHIFFEKPTLDKPLKIQFYTNGGSTSSLKYFQPLESLLYFSQISGAPFSQLYKLENVPFTNGLLEIDNWSISNAFNASVKNVIIPGSVNYIGYNAFAGLPAGVKLQFGDIENPTRLTLEDIEKQAFTGNQASREDKNKIASITIFYDSNFTVPSGQHPLTAIEDLSDEKVLELFNNIFTSFSNGVCTVTELTTINVVLV